MGRIGYSSVTLTDLTETIPVTLVLETGLPQNIQTKVGNLYTPDFSKSGKELIITPSLFRGKEEIYFVEHPEYLKPDGRTFGFLYYEIGSTIYKWEEGKTEGTYVDDEGRLHYNSNLTGNIMIEAYIKYFEDTIHSYTLDLVQATNPISILFLEEGNDNYFATIECEGGREHFEDTNTNAILMTAKLYKGLDNLLDIRPNDFEIKWDRLSDGNTSADSTSSQLSVIRSEVTNRDLFTCEIKDKITGITYVAQQFIYDFTDQYNCIITYDKPLLLSEENTSVKLTASILHKGEKIEEKQGFELSYFWTLVDAKGKEIPLNKTSAQEFIVNTSNSNIPKKEFFTVMCQVYLTTIVDKDEEGNDVKETYVIAANTITFQWAPSYNVRISPKDIFVITGSDGSYQGNANKQYTFNFQLVDKQGNLITFDDTDSNIESISTGTNSDGTTITFKQNTTNKWDFIGTITLSNSLWNSADGSRAYEFTYVYYGQQFTEEVNVIKNRTGAQGSQGFSGYTVDLSNEFHAFAGGEGQADANQSTECLVSAYYGSTALTIKQINLGSTDGPIIYPSSASNPTINYNGKNLFISASTSTEQKVKLNIRTNQTTIEEEKSLFLTEIVPVSFHIEIIDQYGKELTFLKIFTYTINYNGKSYRLIPSANTIVYNEIQKTFTPDHITVSATARQTTGEAIAYPEGKILYSFDEANQNWKIYSNSISGFNGIANIYLRLYGKDASFSSTPTSDEITNAAKYLLDIETVPIITSTEGYQIGGENLLKWSKEMPVETNKWSQNGNVTKLEEENFGVFDFTAPDGSIYAPMFEFTPEMINNTLTFSCYFKVNDWSQFKNITILFAINKNFVYTGEIRQTSGEVVLGKQIISHPSKWGKAEIIRENNKWCKFVWTFTIKEGSIANGGFFDFPADSSKQISVNDAKYCTIGIINTSDNGTVFQVKKMKLEYGNVASAWSASPYDINYYDINGANLISGAKLEYLVQGTDNNSSGYRVVSIALDPNTFYTLSWEKISAKNNCTHFTYQINNGDTVIEEKNLLTSLTNHSITFQTGNSSSYKVLLYAGVKGSIDSTEVLSFHKLKLEKGQVSSPYTLTNEQLQDLLEKVKNESQSYADSINKDLVLTTENGIPTITNVDGSKIQFTGYTDFQNYINNNLSPKLEALDKGIARITDVDLVNVNGVLGEYKKQIQLHNEDNQDPYIEIFAGFYENTNSMKLTKDRLSFSVNGSEVAYFSSNKMFITQADITTTLRIGTSTTEGGKGFLVFTTVKETGVTVTWSNT